MFDAQLVVQVALYVAFGVVGLLAYLSPGVAQAHLDSSGQSGRMSPARSLCFALGLILPFMVVGVALAFAGTFIAAPRLIVTRVAALAITVVALLQLVPARTGLLQKTAHIPKPTGDTAGAALLAGVRQMLGWSPLLTPAALAPLVFATSVHDLRFGCLAVGAFSAGIFVATMVAGLVGSKSAERLRNLAWRIRHGVHLAGVVLLLVAFMVLTGWMNGVTGYLTPFSTAQPEQEQTAEQDPDAVALQTPKTMVDAPSFTLTNQWGETVALEDLRGSIVVLTFWSTESHAAVSAMNSYQGFYSNLQQQKLAEELLPPVDEAEVAAETEPASQADAEGTEAPDALDTPDQTEPPLVFVTVVTPAPEEAPEETAGTDAAAEIAQVQDDTEKAAEPTPEEQQAALLKRQRSGTADEVTALLWEHQATFPVLFDTDGSVFAAYRVTTLPTTYVITSDGHIAGSVVGALTVNQLQRVVQEGWNAELRERSQALAEAREKAAADAEAATAGAVDESDIAVPTEQ